MELKTNTPICPRITSSMLALNPDPVTAADTFAVWMVTTGNCGGGGPITEAELVSVPPYMGVTALPSMSPKPKIRRILLIIFVFMLVIRFVCMFVCMFVCNDVVSRSIHTYRIGKVIFSRK